MTGPRTFEDFAFRVLESGRLTASEREIVYALFEMNYLQANRSYLDKSLDRLRYVSLATANGEPAGFALGEARVVDLPRLPAQGVHLAGICCVSPGFRRRGLFGELERRVLNEHRLPPGPRVMSSGRMAHPASFRGMAANPTAVPRRGVSPTEWQREVGAAIVEIYGSAGFDPEHFVCKGPGEPIGYPVIEVEATPEEWEPFAHVDRARGDSLLGLAWRPDGPPWW